MKFSLSERATEDLESIFYTGVLQFGLSQADAYRAGLSKTFAFLVDYPRAARVRT